MFVIIGAIVVLVSVLGGFAIHGGNLMVLYQPTEYIIICGAGLGALIISAPIPLIKSIVHLIKESILGKDAGKADYVQAISFVYECFKMLNANPISLDKHIEDPTNSDLFQRYPIILNNHHALDFFCDTLKIQLVARMPSYDLDELMEIDISTVHKEEHLAPAIVNKIGDSMPGLGIVAAVLGVVITMGKLTQGKEVIGHSVAAALVGTFIGILLSYGFFSPLATKMESTIASNGVMMSLLRAAINAYTKGCNAKVCAEFARRSVPMECRPTFAEIDEATSSLGKGGAAAQGAAA